MSHYFIEDENLLSEQKKIDYYFGSEKFEFITDNGVFSKDHIDPASELLLLNIPNISGDYLDLGCGYGCIGIILAKINQIKLTQSDVNGLALDLTSKNCEINNVNSTIIKSDCFDDIKGSFDTISLNPPIHAGKSVTYKMYEQSFEHLNINGKIYVVTLKKHGANSTMTKLIEIFGNCEILYKKKGYLVFCATKNK